MLEKQKNIFKAAIIVPIKHNATSVMFWSGIACILVGALWGNIIDTWRFIPIGTGDAVLKIGSAILGAGVFAIIMKSAQFTDLFQKHIAEVFYSPEKVEDIEKELPSRWKAITNALLKGVLPSTHNKASDQIHKQFFNTETQYHFETFEITYDIHIAPDTRVVTITNTLVAFLALSPNHESPKLEQTMEVGGNCELTCLFINDQKQEVENILTIDPNNPKERHLKLDLINFVKNQKSTGEGRIKLERTLKTTQKFTEEPFIVGTISRFIKGAAVVKAKINDGYCLNFRKSGLGDLPTDCYSKDGNGYERWTLARVDDLLLPGQGYIIILLPTL